MNFKTISLGLATAAIAAGSTLAAAPAQALTFTPSEIKFDVDTPVVFKFGGGDALFTDQGLNDFGVFITGAPGSTLIFDGFKDPADVGTTVSFLFQGGVSYELFLQRGADVFLASTNALFSDNTPFDGTLIRFEDLSIGSSDRDFNDYLVTATAVPTPALVPAALGFGAAMLRKRKKTEEDATKANS
ncbi:PTPA-CTERM sorting domain-containing protein [Leptolyngbya sp. FACHB-711]|uniref:PTPA-CTERM sorting domain-containing protein n=1 Tax=Leptolyngbya sp. FACHB-711 TaxID=2692813 RepID=UPI001687DE24|nr:PTPA-CTERM sorting domain-containing protein [Leptolyngbya sp. FACHB-711]MBD2023908.1 PTPA-CTERM sorting domain-containing protein [Leptolyngbya sp. FACHB-711]